MADNDSKYLIEIETLQPNNLKSAFAVIKEQLTESNIDITPEGIHILQMDSTHIVVVEVFLKASQFEKYICKESIKIGIDVVNFTKVLKGVGAKDILTLFVENKNLNDAGDEADCHPNFGIRVENSDKGQVSTFYIDPIEVNEEDLADPDLGYPYNIYMPSSDLQSIVNIHKTLGGDVIQIRYAKNNLSFCTKSDVGRLETIRSKTAKEDSSIKVKKNIEGDDIIEIYIKLSKLCEFTKCSSLSPIATIYLRNDHPLFLEYDIGSLGYIRLGISPSKRPDNF
jgi:proliferating cell nuclear antigen